MVFGKLMKLNQSVVLSNIYSMETSEFVKGIAP